MSKPLKKTDKELFSLIDDKVAKGNYVFLKHSRDRLNQRKILEIDVINILSGKDGYGRKRNKVKDRYDPQSSYEMPEDWNYCIEGCDIDGYPLRIIISFMQDYMPIITVIRIE